MKPQAVQSAVVAVVLAVAVGLMVMAAWHAPADKLAAWGDLILGALFGRLWASVEPATRNTL